MWKEKRVLVTGGAGFIGSHLVEKLLKLGCKVIVADNLSRGTIENMKLFLDKIQFFKVDLTNMKNCLKVTKEIDYVFHLASSVGGIHYIKKDNVGNLTPSLLMNVNMIETSRINNIKRYLFASSACVYREKNSENLNKFKEEDAYPSNPPTTYGWAKIIGERLCEAYNKDYGLKCSSVRIFNAYGERENLNPKWSHAIPSIIRKAIFYPKEDFTIFGDGNQERAFMYVDDCVEGLILSMEKITNADVINLGSEELISIKELVKKIINISGKRIKPKYNPLGPKGTNKYCADTTKMKRILGWVPKIFLEEGLKKTYRWAKKRLETDI